jgi:L-rhamnose isomerase
MTQSHWVKEQYKAARDQYAEYGIDTDAILRQAREIPISMHCWQGDDITGLEGASGGTSGGILTTGAYPGKARNGDELRADIDQAMALLPGKQRLNLHASYAEFDQDKPRVDRDAYETRHFSRWIDWARQNDIGLDFNPTCFGHAKAADDLTLAHPKEDVRRFWIEHCKACRRIAADMGQALGQPVINNIWVPDGMKDMPADRLYFRHLLKESLDEILAAQYPAEHVLDSVECKLFGIGVESYTVGSHEFYMGYVSYARAQGQDNLMLTLDMGHFHPTETIADKLSSLLLFYPKLLVHVSRGVKWDSDHVVISDENVFDVMREIKRANGFGRVFLATDFFDGSINRIAAWVIGIRSAQKALLAALLEPTDLLKKAELEQRYTDRLALMEEARSLPYTAVWNQFCLEDDVPVGRDWLPIVHAYEKDVLSQRN